VVGVASLLYKGLVYESQLIFGHIILNILKTRVSEIDNPRIH